MPIENDISNRWSTGSGGVIRKSEKPTGVDRKECITGFRDTPLMSPGSDGGGARPRTGSAGMGPGRCFLGAIAESHRYGHSSHYFPSRRKAEDVPIRS